MHQETTPSTTKLQSGPSLPGAPVKQLKFLYSALDNYGGYPFSDLFDVVQGVYKPDDMLAENSCLVLWGGGDISPSIYGQHPSSKTYAERTPSSKDQLELALAGRAIKKGMPIIGICRGAQMMCSLAGGSLVQHVDGHAGKDHYISTNDGRIFLTTSIHHQMMYPWDVDHRLIAWSDPPQSEKYIKGNSMNDKVAKDMTVVFPASIESKKREVEIIYLPGVKTLCIQGHPEFIHNEEHAFIKYCQELVIDFLIKPFLK